MRIAYRLDVRLGDNVSGGVVRLRPMLPLFPKLGHIMTRSSAVSSLRIVIDHSALFDFSSDFMQNGDDDYTATIARCRSPIFRTQ